jgi:hypothetical protein
VRLASGSTTVRSPTPAAAGLALGIHDGTIRGDLTVEELGFVLGQLLLAAARASL